MKKSTLWLSCFLTFFSVFAHAQTIHIDTLLEDKISIRAIAIDGKSVWYGADKGRFGKIDFEKRTRDKRQVFLDTMKIEFRNIAQTSKAVFVLKIGNPALLYKIDKSTMAETLVYSEQHPNVFYDSMQFWDDLEGMAMGDPIDGCFSILTTRDGGNTWQKKSCKDLPVLAQGEAAFAASNTNLVVNGNQAWMVSGGKKARVFHSPDRGKTWSTAETPIEQGQAMTGIYTADFYDEKRGVVAGGNYDQQQQNTQNKAMTRDGGKTWQLVANGAGFGYASCIQYVPDSKGMKLVCVGGTGVYFSDDAGQTWKQLSTDRDFYTLRFIDGCTAIAAGKNKLVRLTFK
ncbi:sialidase family protein [Flavobacterium caeni]|uniref:Oxidoreductase n=1 Tax=Flavobacterium caeni TaxID=490189 RepID=A0A1G5CCB1_9FLAO|nr:oxidoreductase [Flavobacterium caeni]SCY00095.1 Uncharacterized protein SAMN02927903_00497 [Flavobacterium caeni]